MWVRLAWEHVCEEQSRLLEDVGGLVSRGPYYFQQRSSMAPVSRFLLRLLSTTDCDLGVYARQTLSSLWFEREMSPVVSGTEMFGPQFVGLFGEVI